jgi:hypothetical protein
MPEYEFIGKSRLTRGFSFPLKRSVLDAHLNDCGIKSVTGVAYCGPADDHRVLGADYHGPRNRRMVHTLNIWVNAVPSAIRHHVAQRLEKELLAKLVDWINRLGDPSKLSNQMDHRFEIYYGDMTEDGKCMLDVRVDAPRNQWQSPRFRAKVRP